jgi:hypothetical protein
LFGGRGELVEDVHFWRATVEQQKTKTTKQQNKTNKQRGVAHVHRHSLLLHLSIIIITVIIMILSWFQGLKIHKHLQQHEILDSIEAERWVGGSLVIHTDVQNMSRTSL